MKSVFFGSFIFGIWVQGFVVIYKLAEIADILNHMEGLLK